MTLSILSGALAGLIFDPIMFVFIYCALVTGFAARRHYPLLIVIALGVAMNLGLSYSTTGRGGQAWPLDRALAGAAATVIWMAAAWALARLIRTAWLRRAVL
ncbi:hypothetical protein DFR52_1011179 [Hoeflea marina]|uniref:Uncharacterized protein n=1 Tax=Hoeflea marina TaxID=274592 RepID=A0A317PY94_9HYPH|nr:hypothetical protein [Hoeflea marina]PWW04480.1 hypothetical protein DFR52_1011179 [Hoeflea marina]